MLEQNLNLIIPLIKIFISVMPILLFISREKIKEKKEEIKDFFKN